MDDRKVKVLVVDDSKVARMFVVHLLESDPQIRVIGAVSDGQAALDFVRETKPDVVLMDIHMPRMDGFEATRRMMETHPVPIIICSATTDPQEVAATFRLMEAGAVAFLEKPLAREHADFDAMVTNLLQTVKLMAEVKVVRRWARGRITPPPPLPAKGADGPSPPPVKLIGIGASTGGPPVLQTILCGLPKDFPIPILIVQHIAQGFLSGLAEWLNQTTAFQVHTGSHGTEPKPGHVYLAPDGFHMGVTPGLRISLSTETPENSLRPAVSYLFRSMADACGGATAGVLLTGMGEDGAAELKLLKDRGALTIAQDLESSVVHGMPGKAIALGGATYVLSADKIADALVTYVGHRNGGRRK